MAERDWSNILSPKNWRIKIWDLKAKSGFVEVWRNETYITDVSASIDYEYVGLVELLSVLYGDTLDLELHDALTNITDDALKIGGHEHF
jgi:hypothetical protein